MNGEAKARAVSTVANGGEVYAWLDQYESESSFAFVVVHLGRRDRHWFRKLNEGWWVSLHRKRVDVGRDWFDCVDALKPDGQTVTHACIERHEFPTPEEAIDFAVSRFHINEFSDYGAINKRYLQRYRRK